MNDDERMKRWREKNPEKDSLNRQTYEDTWKLKHPGFETRGQYNYRQAKNFIINVLGGGCAKCGITNILVLDIEHKNGDGKKFRDKTRQFRGGLREEFGGIFQFKYWLKNNIEEGKKRFQILCANCHRLKTHEWSNR